MNKHEAKCRNLKAIRRKLADTVGIDLHQRECTNPGNCRGTCPKCESEEKKLNEALLKRGAIGAVAAAMSIGLAGCSSEDIMRVADTFKHITGLDRQEYIDELMGDVPYIDENNGSGDDIIETTGEVAPPEDDDYIEELTGEVDESYYDYEAEGVGE